MHHLNAEQRQELDKFPPVLKQLIEAELAAGNAIEQIGGGFPAPPAGAMIKLARKISSRPRAAGDGLEFRERHSSLSSGEFTDAQRLYFVVEPPDPPPPEPDMDAIRKALEPKRDAWSQSELINSASGQPLLQNLSEREPQQVGRIRSLDQLPLPRPAIRTTSTGSTHLLHFRDQRPPHEIQFNLEGKTMALFRLVPDDECLCWTAEAIKTGARYALRLSFVAATETENYYSLQSDAIWREQSVANQDYFARSAAGWFSFWTRDFEAADPTPAGTGSPEQYQRFCCEARMAQIKYDSVPAIQQAILTRMKQGHSFRRSHKEGGTNLSWQFGKFIRSDYGDDPATEQFADEEAFLTMLRQFCQWDLSRNSANDQINEVDAWRLILRRLSE